MRERRRFKRYHIAMDATYMKVFGNGSIRSFTTAENISRGGICAKMSGMINKGDEILLELKQATYQETLIALAKVKWVIKGDKAKANRYGLEFQWVSSSSLLGNFLSAIDNAAVA